MVDPVHEASDQPRAKARITVTSVFDLDPKNYRDVEFPPGSGETKSLTDPEEMLEFEQHQLETDEIDFHELLDIGMVTDGDIKLELVEEPDRGNVSAPGPGTTAGTESKAAMELAEAAATGWRDETTGLISGPLPEPNND